MSTPLESRNCNLVKKSLFKRDFNYASSPKSNFLTGSSFYPATTHKSIMRYRTQKIKWQELKQAMVFIDAANLESSVKELGWHIDYIKLRRLFGKQLIEIRDYCVHIAKELIESSDKYIDLKNLRIQIERQNKARLLQRAVDNR